jgi:glycosyltransferase involved in cell wall biosynthesis
VKISSGSFFPPISTRQDFFYYKDNDLTGYLSTSSLQKEGTSMTLISLVVPCYNEQASIPIFYKTVEKILTQFANHSGHYQWEYWFINDGSTDKTLDELEILNTKDPNRVHYIDFTRNFGKEAALLAGFTQADGQYIGVMDVDLQDPPELLPKMIELLDTTDNDVIATQRTGRNGEPRIRSWCSDRFYSLINKISKVKMRSGVRDYRLMRRSVVTAIISLPEYNRFSKGIFSWVGFKTKYLTFPHHDRVAGKTHWSFSQLVSYSLDGIMDFSAVPLAIASWIGIISFILAIFGLIFIVVRALIYGDPTIGWPSLVTIILMVGGIQLLCLGIIGKYISKIYLETKHRPLYLIKKER